MCTGLSQSPPCLPGLTVDLARHDLKQYHYVPYLFQCFHKDDSDGGLGWSETSLKEEEDEPKDGGRILKGEKGPAGSSLSVEEIGNIFTPALIGLL